MPRRQYVWNRLLSTLEAAAEEVITVIASASMLPARLNRILRDYSGIRSTKFATNARGSKPFVPMTQGVRRVRVGMSRPKHVEENLRSAEILPDPADSLQTRVNAA